MKVICFHNPEEENGYLSNWYPSKFCFRGTEFSSMEQYMMWVKARTFHDESVAEKILSTDNVADIKALGRKVRNYGDTIWSGIRQIVVYEGLRQKFSQDQDLRQKLLSTGDNILAECAVRDTIWGIGLSMRDNNRFNIDKWRGSNLLGFSLMRVRDTLQIEN